MNRAADARRGWASLVLMVASGFAGLSYQIVWTQQCGLWLGHESAAVLAVLAAFFGGLATGALALGARIAKSARAVRWYAGCEILIALWSALVLLAMPAFSSAALRLTGPQPTPVWQWLVAFLGTFLLFLPATAAMGATLPAMERIAAQRSRGGRNQQSIAALYAGNTFGAVIGVLAAAFWLVPTMGLARTAGVSIALNLACGVLALIAFPARLASADLAAPAFNPSGGVRRVLAQLAVTGFLGIGYEVVVVRVLSQVTENTVYTFAMLLAVYLVGSAAGAAAYHRWLQGSLRGDGRTNDDHDLRWDELGDRLLGALAAACLVSGGSLWLAEQLKAWLQATMGEGGGVTAGFATEAALAAAAFGPPTFVMGAVFSHFTGRAAAAGVSFGRAVGVNTVGAAVAPAAFGVLGIPALGPKAVLLVIGAGYLALATPRRWSRPLLWAPAAVAAVLALFAPPLRFVDVPEGGGVVSYREGVLAAVTVVEDASGVERMRINNRQQEGSSATFHVDARQAWLPLLLHPAPGRALFLGLGTGVTARAAAEDSMLEVDVVELLPEVIDASATFSPAADAATNSSLRVIAADARRYVRASDQRYAVIVSDNFHPARSGSGALYTFEHFQAVRDRLDRGGVFCQWLPLHQLDTETLRSIVQSFMAAYPHGWAMLASNSLETPVLGLVGRVDDRPFDAGALRERLARRPLPVRISGLGLEDEFAVLGSFIAGPAALRQLAGDAPANTDDRPIVVYRAPRVTYAPDMRPRDRLIALLQAVSIEPGQLVLPGRDPAWSRRLAAYWLARDRFIAAGRDVRPAERVQEMLAQVREPLLAVLRISPDFRPAYDPLLSMATALVQSDAAGARVLLTELTRLQPARGEAMRALTLMNAN